MMESDEAPLIKYEQILLADEPVPDSRPGTSKESSESSDSSEEEYYEMSAETADYGRDPGDPDRAKAVRKETVGRILDSVFMPRKVEKNGKMYLLRLSRHPASKDEVIELSETFEGILRERQAKMYGSCPVRRELYDLLFNELIRQSTIECAERGSLLLRVRDEFLMTMNAHQKLYECGMEYGARKALEADMEQQRSKVEYTQLQAEVQRVEQRKKQLEAEMAAEEELLRHSFDVKQTKHEERMAFLRKLNRQLKEQITYIS